MRLALILASNLYMSPYIRYYTDILDQMGIAYDVIGWNRYGVDEPGVIALNLPSSLQKGIIGRLFDYLRYRRFVQSKLKHEKYDKIIVFTIVNALLLLPFLIKHYKTKYILDVRDYNPAVKWLPSRLSAAVQNAAMTAISSQGFKRWLPKNKVYCISHNTHIFSPLPSVAKIPVGWAMPTRSLEGQPVGWAAPTQLPKFKILTIGAIGYFDANRAMIESLADDPRFELLFIGSGYAEQMLKDFVQSNGIKNVAFHGRYEKKDEPKFLEGASLLSILIDDSVNSITCMSNRFYLSLVYGVPMMVDSGTEQARWVEKYNLGVIIDKKMDIKPQVIQFLQTYDADKFDTGRRACLEIIRQDVEEFQTRFKEFLSVSSS